MAYTREDIRTEVRDNIYESVADLVTDAQLNRMISAELRGLPRKNIYIEELRTSTTVVDQLDYSLPTNTYKVELVERNWGTASQPTWEEIKGWDNYDDALWLKERPSSAWTMRIHIRKGFTVLSDDVTASDVPDDKMEVVIFGVVVRAYKMILGYFLDAKNWDAIAKPDGVSLNQILNLYREAKEDYKDAVNKYKTSPRPRDIDLVN